MARDLYTVLNYIMDIGTKLTDIWAEQSRWSQATFGSDKERGPTGPLLHLMKEVGEVLAKPNDIVEFADIGLLWIDAARRAGHNLFDLIKAMEDKQKVNIARKWPKPTDPLAPVEHDRTQDS